MAEAQNPGNKKMTTELSPDIVMFHILPRLPAKSVGRFRCVSREWQSFLTTHHFAKMHLLHQNQNQNQNQKLLLLFTKKPYTFRTIDCEITPTTKHGLSASRPLSSVEVGSCKAIRMSIVASLHGLVYIKRHQLDKKGNPEYTDLILWNPLTSDYKTLSKRSSDRDRFFIEREGRFGLYYSTCDDDYKFLRLTKHPNPKLYIYSLKSDSLREVTETTNRTSTSNDMNSYIFNDPNVLLNEKLYFIKQVTISGQLPLYSIMMFDTKREKMREIETPTLINEQKAWMGLMVVRGSIHLSVAFKDPRGVCHRMELWKMNGSYGNWTKLVTYSPIECFWRREKPLHIMRNGDWLVHNTERGHVLQRDMNKHTYDIICTFKNMQISDRWKYMETLVSPNQYIN